MQKYKPIIFLITIIAALSGILFGFDTGVISGAILFIRKDFNLSTLSTEIVVSVVLFGAFIGATLLNKLADYIGRHHTIVVSAFLFIIGALLSAFATSVNYLIIYRFIIGVAIGLSSFCAPLYISEMAPTNKRGTMICIYQLTITIGIFLSYLTNFMFSENDHNWRIMIGIGAIPAILLAIGMFFLYDSPRWLISRNNTSKAREVLESIYYDKQYVEKQIDSIHNSIKTEKKASIKELFSKKSLPILYITIGLAFFQQFTGINTIIYYTPTILEMEGFHDSTAAIFATTIIGAINVLFTLIAIKYIDKWGRKPLLYYGLSGMILGLIIMTATFFYPEIGKNLKWMSTIGIIIYVASFAMSLGPLMYVFIAELFPLDIRAMGTGLATGLSWLFNLIVAVSFLSLVNLLSLSGVMLVFIILCILGLIFVKMVVPETKGVSLETIEKNLNDRKPMKDLGYKS